MAKRYKTTPCIYCGFEFLNNQEHPLCEQCIKDIRLGRERRKEVEALKAEDGLRYVTLGHSWLRPSSDLKDRQLDVDTMEEQIITTVLELAGKTTAERVHGRFDGGQFVPHPLAMNIAVYHDPFRSHDSTQSAMVPTRQVPIVERLVKLFGELLTYEYARGLREGDSFLMRMARGDVTIDKLNEHERKIR